MKIVDSELRTEPYAQCDITDISGCLNSAVTHRPRPECKFDSKPPPKKQASNLIRVSPDFVAVVDAADFHLVSQFSWSVKRVPNGKTFYAQSTKGLLMHRLIMGVDCPVDHKDGDGLNNRRENLRAATQSQNCANRRKHQIGKSKYKGVTPRGKKWAAEVRRRAGRGMDCFYLGLFDTEEAAAAAYNLKAAEIWPEHSRPNPLPA